MKNIALFARSSLVLAAFCLAPLARADDLTTKFQQYMDAAVKVEGFSGSVLVSRGGETLFSHGYGLADIEHLVPNTPRTKFRIGSITKQFTAMAVLILAGGTSGGARGRTELQFSSCGKCRWLIQWGHGETTEDSISRRH